MPSGFVRAKMISAKTRIWIHPTRVMGASELFRNEKRVDEVDGERQRNEGAQPVFELHGSSLEAIAAARVNDAQREERDGHGNEDQVRHGPPLVTTCVPSLWFRYARENTHCSLFESCKMQGWVTHTVQGARPRSAPSHDCHELLRGADFSTGCRQGCDCNLQNR